MTLTAQVGIVSDRNLAARIIQRFIGSRYNHAIVALDDEWCVSAEPPGALRRPIAFFAEADIVWSRLELTDEQAAAVIDWATGIIGTPYSRLDFIAAAIASILRDRTPAWVARITNRGRRMVCSQLAAAAVAAAGIHLAEARYGGVITPGDIARAFVELGWTDTP